MGAFEYLLLFAAVILGLAISDLAISLHRLLNAFDRVRWDVLTILAACLALVRIVTQWWTWYAADRLASGLTFGMFLGVLVSAVLLFLMAAVALPDEIDKAGVDLRAYFARTKRRYWILFAGQWIALNGVSDWAQVSIAKVHLNLWSPVLLVFPATLLLAFVSARWVQAIGLVGFLVLYGVVYFGQTLA